MLTLVRVRVMTKQKFTVFLIPDDEGYQAIIPHYTEAITGGDTPDEAFANAKEALEAVLEGYSDPVPSNVRASHVISGEIEIDLPDSMLVEVREWSEVETRLVEEASSMSVADSGAG